MGNVGVTGYGIYRDGQKVGQVNGSTLTYTDENLAAGTYKYKVDAVDSAGNRSDRAAMAAVTAVIANDPPVAPYGIISFPQRDYVEASGFDAAEGPVKVSVLRKDANGVWQTISQSNGITPDATGLVEVNHAGAGGCWTVNTPDIRPGDVVRATNSQGIADQTTTANITSQRAIQTASGTVVVHGTAADAQGNPLPVDQIEQRLVSTGNNFALNGRNELRAASTAADGTLSYDAPGSTKWTATYTGLNANDVNRAVNAETAAQWLGRAPLAGTEGTIFETGAGIAGGPATPDCTAPTEPNAPLADAAPNNLAFGDQSAVPASTSAQKSVRLSNSGSSDLKASSAYIAGLNPGDFAIGANTCPATLAPGASCTVGVTFSPKAVGARSASLNLQTSAANQGDFNIGLSGNGTDVAAPAAPGRPTQAITGTELGANTVPVKLNWAPSASGNVTHYQLQQSIGGGAFTDVTPQPGTATSTTLNLSNGSYRYQVRACNNANCSAWSLAPAFNLSAVQEGNGAISYGGTWTNQAVTGAFGGSVRHASTSKDKATYKFTGTQAEWIGTTGPNRGRAEVWLDGVRVATVDLYSPTVGTKQVLFSRDNLSAAATHQLEVRVLGARNPSSTGTRVDIDAFVSIR
ncbi:MAG TPA: choice-of-anchor D domain-containing protein [Rubrobacter sp.]|nr:choice-of-anchor D domain-containing protein [Rubrobacter sp.]